MIKKYTHKSITWIDAESPTTEEVSKLMEEYNIDSSVAKDLKLPTYKDKVTQYKDYLYLVMHFPAYRHSHDKDGDQEIDFIIGKNFVITTRYETIDPLERFSKMFEVNNILDKGIMEDHAGYIFYYIIKEMYRAMSDELDSINDSLKTIEKNIFKGLEKEMVTELSKVNRNLINLNHIVLSHKDVLESVDSALDKIFDEAFTDNFEKILNEYYRIESVLVNSIDFLRELRDTNDSLLSSKQNETMKILTVITFLALPFSVITGLFQMNTTKMPLINSPYGWHIIIGIELIVVIAFFVFVKMRKWL